MLDRTKEPGVVGEPLYLDVVAALRRSASSGLAQFDAEPLVMGGRYGLVLQGVHPGDGQGDL